MNSRLPFSWQIILLVVAVAGFYLALGRLRESRWKTPRRMMGLGLPLVLPWVFSYLLIYAAADDEEIRGCVQRITKGHEDVAEKVAIAFLITGAVGCLLALTGLLMLSRRTMGVARRTRELEALAATLRVEVEAREAREKSP